jgi:hypothetical protein
MSKENIIFDFTEETPPTEGWLRFGEDYEIEVYHNNEWIKLEEYERIRSEEKDGNL